MAKRFDTKSEAFDYSATEGGLIYQYYADFYVIPFQSVEWAEKARMKLVDDFSDMGIPKPYHQSEDYRNTFRGVYR